jgi:hypothetical protein
MMCDIFWGQTQYIGVNETTPVKSGESSEVVARRVY